MRIQVLGAMLVALLLSSVASAADFKVIVNSANSINKISRADLNAIFLKKMGKWSDNTPMAPVNQVKRSAVRDSFTTTVHAKSVGAVDSYWQQQIFSGRDLPPPEKSTDADIVAFVKSNPGAVGYVAEGAPTSGVKVVGVE